MSTLSVMRRLLIALLSLLLLTGGVAALASGSDPQTEPREERRADKPRAGHHRGGMHHAVKRMVLRSLADRLDVAPRELRVGLRSVIREQKRAYFSAAGLTAKDRRALRSCHRSHRSHRRHRAVQARRRCDRPAVKAALEKLRAHEPDLAAIKETASTDLATRLGLDRAKLLEAFRAEAALRLDQAVKLGFVSDEGRNLALACFDTPADCDLAALRGEFRHRGRHG